jgi:hypothetical protein
MVALTNRDMEINGIPIGLAHDVFIVDLQVGDATITDQDAPLAGRDGLAFGRDTHAPSPWTISFCVNQTSGPTAVATLEKLSTMWNDLSIRSDPGSEVLLRYSLGGRTRSVFGRPRRWSSSPTNLLEAGRIDAVGEFQPSDQYTYADDLGRITLNMIGSTPSGLIFPVIFPWGTTLGGQRQGVIPDTGTGAPTPIVATMHGPIANPFLSGDGWRIDLLDTIPYDMTVTIDSRLGTVVRSDGANLSGKLSRTTRLSDALLGPGAQELVFGGNDLTGTATCVVEWHSRSTSL